MQEINITKAELILIFILIGSFSSIFAFLLTPLVAALARKQGLFDIPGVRRIHTELTPRLGGIAVVLAFILGLLFFERFGYPSLDLCAMIHDIPSSFLLGLLCIFVSGLIDDLFGLAPPVKLAAQLIAAITLLAGLSLEDKLLGYSVSFEFAFAVHILWVLLAINAFNLIDGVDGLATPLATVALLGLLGMLLMKSSILPSFIISSYIGALVGFYPYNRYPARIFLGDCGSMANGFVFAYASLAGGTKSSAIGAAIIPFLAAAIPLIDLTLAVWRRGVRKLSSQLSKSERRPGLMTGDLEHLHHRLMKKKFSTPDVAAVLVLVNALVVFVALISIQFGSLVVLTGSVSLIVSVYLALTFLPAPEIVATSHLLYVVVSEVRSKIIAFLFFILLDCGVLFVSWFVSKSLSGTLSGSLSSESFQTFFVLNLPILCTLFISDYLIGLHFPKLATLSVFCVSLLVSFLYLDSKLQASLYCIALTVLSFLVRRSIATLDKLSLSPFTQLEVSLYSRLKRKQGVVT